MSLFTRERAQRESGICMIKRLRICCMSNAVRSPENEMRIEGTVEIRYCSGGEDLPSAPVSPFWAERGSMRRLVETWS